MRIQKARAYLETLGTRHPSVRRALLSKIEAVQLNALCEVCANILARHVPLKQIHKKKLCKHKAIMRLLADRKVPPKTKVSLLKKPQIGGFLPIIAALIPAVISAITAAVQ